ncbi:MAG: MarR family transcriptional regulator [Gammaproteobacteria bacterium]|nr:MarR family transcriptional regulator [Gammaproteobacteria bacterium]MCP5425687.1 MarR family transcriptional regulator [Gammaproteobacteria bacterium]MCP5459718.1 MarR family transcriptional regulator [Gammaproteobacteria bacterium]
MSTRQHTLGFFLVDVTRLMRRAFQAHLQARQSDLTLAKARALVYLSRNEGVRQVELADMLEIQPITLARLIDQLAETGLVERRSDPNDRRAFQLHLTDKAAPHLELIEQVTATVRDEMLRGIDQQQVSGMMDALARMRENLTAR